MNMHAHYLRHDHDVELFLQSWAGNGCCQWIYIYIYNIIYIYKWMSTHLNSIWRLPAIGDTPSHHPFLDGIFHRYSAHFGYPLLWKPIWGGSLAVVLHRWGAGWIFQQPLVISTDCENLTKMKVNWLVYYSNTISSLPNFKFGFWLWLLDATNMVNY